MDILFMLWAVRALTPAGLASLRIDGRRAAEEAWLREKLARDGAPSDTHNYIRMLKSTGKVRFHACRLAASTFEVGEGDLIPEAQGIVDSSWFLKEKVAHADHCQYFEAP